MVILNKLVVVVVIHTEKNKRNEFLMSVFISDIDTAKVNDHFFYQLKITPRSLSTNN